MTHLTPEDRRDNEKTFEKALRDYMLNPEKYQFGGILNALSTFISLLEEFSENEEYLGMNSEALDFAVEKLNAVHGECDLNYSRSL